MSLGEGIERDVALGIISMQSQTLKGLLSWIRANLAHIVLNGDETVTISKDELVNWEKIIVQILKTDTKIEDIENIK